jgi:transposase
MVGDKESRKILEQVAKKPLSVPEILQICKLSKTSGYRKINNLNRNGYLVRTGFVFTSKKRTVDKYTMFWEKIIIEMKEGTYVVKMKISKKSFNNSSVIQTIYKKGL